MPDPAMFPDKLPQQDSGFFDKAADALTGAGASAAGNLAKMTRAIRDKSQSVFESLANSSAVYKIQVQKRRIVRDLKYELGPKITTIANQAKGRMASIGELMTTRVIDPAKDVLKNMKPLVDQLIEKLDIKFYRADSSTLYTENPEALPSPGPNETVAYDRFVDFDGKVIGFERATRTKTVDILRTGYPDEAEGIPQESTWASTVSIRELFRTRSRQEAKEHAVPVLANSWMQTLQNSEGAIVSSVSRSAALSDFAHGEISLQELKDYRQIEQLAKNQSTLDEAAQGRLKEMYLWRRGSSWESVAADIKKRALVSYGADKLTVDPSDDLKRAIDRAVEGRSQPGDDGLFATVELDGARLEAVIQSRERTIKIMALQDLYAHFEQVHADQDETLYSRVSLTDMEKMPKDESGFILDEHTQTMDMKSLYDSLEGVQVLFDLDEGRGPYFDDLGQIHMPSAFAGKVSSTVLHTVFFNISIQMHTDNTGIQKWINDEALAKLRQYSTHNEHTVRLSDSLRSVTQKTPHETAMEAVLALQEGGGRVGVNCFGGKDRTGYVIALVTRHHLQKLLPPGSLRTKQQSKLVRKWGRQLVGKTGIAAFIAKLNANHSWLKVTGFGLSLYGTSTPRGKMFRTAALASLGQTLLKTMITGKRQASKVVGQLYFDTLGAADSQRLE